MAPEHSSLSDRDSVSKKKNTYIYGERERESIDIYIYIEREREREKQRERNLRTWSSQTLKTLKISVFLETELMKICGFDCLTWQFAQGTSYSLMHFFF